MRNISINSPDVLWRGKLSYIPGTVLAFIWKKVSEYLPTPNVVIQVPSEDECIPRYSVYSLFTQNPNSVNLT